MPLPYENYILPILLRSVSIAQSKKNADIAIGVSVPLTNHDLGFKYKPDITSALTIGIAGCSIFGKVVERHPVIG